MQIKLVQRFCPRRFDANEKDEEPQRRGHSSRTHKSTTSSTNSSNFWNCIVSDKKENSPDTDTKTKQATKITTVVKKSDATAKKSKPSSPADVNKNKLKTKESTKKQTLPDTWYYSSNHILVNRERAILGLTQLTRVRMLDDMARFHAEAMAESQKLFHSVDDLDQLKKKISGHNVSKCCDFAGENVQRGKSIRWMHTAMMASGKKSRDNILSKKYTEFGMGTAKGEDGKLYMVQLFRGNKEKKVKNSFRNPLTRTGNVVKNTKKGYQ